MRKPSIKTSFRTLTDSGFDVKAIIICDSMTGNDYFPAPVPEITTISNLSKQYNIALVNSMQGNIVDITLKNGLRRQLTGLLMQLSNYVKAVATDRVMLSTTGFDMTGDGTASVITKPGNIKMTDGVNAGELILKCSIVKGAKSYGHQYTLDPITPDSVWTEKLSTRSKYIFKNLKSGGKYWGRIRVVGSHNQEIMSDAVCRIAQ